MLSSAHRLEFDEVLNRLRPELQELVICISHSWGGLEQVAAQDAIDRSELGLKVSVACLEGSPVHEALKSHPKVQVLPLDFRPRDYFDFKLKRELNRIIGEGVNLIHCHQPSLLGSISPWIRPHPRVALFASRHIMNSHDKRDFFHAWVYSRLDSLIVMSHTLRRNVLDTHPLREKQVQVVNLGLDFKKFDPARVDARACRQAWGANDKTLVIGLVGRIDPAKGQATFIRAAAGLTKSYGDSQSIRFVMVGEETLGRASHHLDELKEMVAQFKMESSVVFAGYQQNIPEVMSAFDILVMPSRQEAFGLVAIEAMAMQTPIIISKGGSAAEIVGNDEYGLLTRPEDAFDLQQKLKWMIEHPEARAEMGKKARAFVINHYDRKERIHRTLELYEWALRKRRHF